MMKRSWFHRHGLASCATQPATARSVCDAGGVALVHASPAFGTKIGVEIDGDCRGDRELLCQYESGKEGLPMMKIFKRATVTVAANKLALRKDTIRALSSRELQVAVGGDKAIADGISASCIACP